MCGINGFTFENKFAIEEMNKLLDHRGPDSNGTYIEGISLGHTRLKIIDLSERAAQPMSDYEEKILLVFNGEIYNFKEIRKQLEEEGYKFKSDSDTEVIIHAYKKWGYDCVKHFNGMWAFAIYDKNKNKLFLSRDRLGKKPLYYCVKGNNLIFSSEIKPLFLHKIEKKLNKKSVSSYLSYRYVLGEDTMFDNIFKLLPAHNLVFDFNEKKIEKIWEYWDVNKENLEIEETEAENKIENLFKEAISLRQISDVPIGSTNSGGLDSSITSAIMAKIHKAPIMTFTVKFSEKDFDETKFARILAESSKTIHKEITVDVDNFLTLMKEYVKKKDEPIGIPNEIATYLMFKKIKKYVTVVLVGEGADEIFAGYSRIFRSPYDYERLKILEREDKEVYEKEYPLLFEKYNGRFFNNEIEHFMFLYNYFPEEEKNFILKEECKKNFTPFFKKYFDKLEGSYSKKIAYTFIKNHLPVILAKLDNSAMASAVEVRCPFLDYRLIDYALNISFEFKNPWKSEEHKLQARYMSSDEIAEEYDISKYILKKIAKKYIPNVIIERKKKGFPVPLQKWFKGDFFEVAKNLLFSEDSKIDMVANKQNLKKWVEQGVYNSDKNFGQKLWMLVSLELWLREWF